LKGESRILLSKGNREPIRAILFLGEGWLFVLYRLAVQAHTFQPIIESRKPDRDAVSVRPFTDNGRLKNGIAQGPLSPLKMVFNG
jgi:hypothetical protein